MTATRRAAGDAEIARAPRAGPAPSVFSARIRRLPLRSKISVFAAPEARTAGRARRRHRRRRALVRDGDVEVAVAFARSRAPAPRNPRGHADAPRTRPSTPRARKAALWIAGERLLLTSAPSTAARIIRASRLHLRVAAWPVACLWTSAQLALAQAHGDRVARRAPRRRVGDQVPSARWVRLNPRSSTLSGDSASSLPRPPPARGAPPISARASSAPPAAWRSADQQRALLVDAAAAGARG